MRVRPPPLPLTDALVVQRTGRHPPKVEVQVRFLAGVLGIAECGIRIAESRTAALVGIPQSEFRIPQSRHPGGETDITPRFERGVPGSSPGRGTERVTSSEPIVLVTRHSSLVTRH